MVKWINRSRRKGDPRGETRATGKTRQAPQADTPLPSGGGVYALMGATGGVGTTSAACALAVHIADRLARMRTGAAALTTRPGESRVCLIDLDFEAGACAHHLDLLPSLGADDLRRAPSQIDAAVLSSMVDQTVAGVTLISAPNGGQAAPDPRTVLALLDAATQLFEHVVLDVPRALQPWTPAVLAGADVSCVLAELTVPSLHMARLRRMQLAPVLGATGRSLLPVLAKLERRGGHGSLSARDAATALGEPHFASLPMDPEPLRAVINSGEPLAVARPDSRYMRDVRGLANALFAQVHDTGGQAETNDLTPAHAPDPVQERAA